MISIKRNDDRKPLSAAFGKAAVLASAMAMVAALAVTSANASANSCGRALGKCQSSCAKRSIGQDVCYKRCERAFMKCD